MFLSCSPRYIKVSLSFSLELGSAGGTSLSLQARKSKFVSSHVVGAAHPLRLPPPPLFLAFSSLSLSLTRVLCARPRALHPGEGDRALSPRLPLPPSLFIARLFALREDYILPARRHLYESLGHWSCARGRCTAPPRRQSCPLQLKAR